MLGSPMPLLDCLSAIAQATATVPSNQQGAEGLNLVLCTLESRG